MHLDPDAPLIHLLSIKHNPLLVLMTDEELREFVIRLRTPKEPKKKPSRIPKEPKAKTSKEPSLEARRAAVRDAI